jgi:hypothetical protein
VNFIIGKPLSRRTVLRGAGAALALPFLDAMSPISLLRAQTPASPAHRFQAIYVPNGMAMQYWTPGTEGKDFELSPILEPLAPFKDQMLVLSGIDATWNNIHAGASGSFLTGATHGGRNNTETLADVSIDQLLARKLGQETQVASLELAMDKPANAGVCSGTLNCAYTHTISWRSPTQPLPMESNPRAVFERLFGDTGSTDRSARARRLRQQRSILDSVRDEVAALKRELGAGDNLKIDEYSEAVRDVERRIQMAEEQIDFELPRFDAPQGAPASFEEHMELMFDLQLLAFQADLTRVGSFMLGKEQSARPYPQIGVPEAHHPLSHHNNVPALVEQMSKINRYHVELVSRYVQKLSDTPDGDGSLLDHMTMLYGGGISNSTVHSGIDLPLMVLGGGNGRLHGGQHIRYTDSPIMANLLVTLMDKLEMPLDRVGGSTGRLEIDTLSGL